MSSLSQWVARKALWSMRTCSLFQTMLKPGSMLIVYSERDYFSSTLGQVIMSLHCSSYVFLITVFVVQFFYRYAVLCKYNQPIQCSENVEFQPEIAEMADRKPHFSSVPPVYCMLFHFVFTGSMGQLGYFTEARILEVSLSNGMHRPSVSEKSSKSSLTLIPCKSLLQLFNTGL